MQVSSIARRFDVVVVGAGLARLATTRQLVADGVDVLLLEAADAPGRRVRTDRQDGLQLDRSTGHNLVHQASLLTSTLEVRQRRGNERRVGIVSPLRPSSRCA